MKKSPCAAASPSGVCFANPDIVWPVVASKHVLVLPLLEVCPQSCSPVFPALKFLAVGNLSLPFTSGKIRLEGQVEVEAAVFWNEFRGSNVCGMGVWVGKDSKCQKIFSKTTRSQKAAPHKLYSLSLLCSFLPRTVPAEEGFAVCSIPSQTEAVSRAW